MIISVASGKGGTGKTTVSVNLARTIGRGVQLLDCDVEEPNAHLFLRGRKTGCDNVTIPIPEVDEWLCDGCGECGRFCRYHAIVSFGSTPLVFPQLCHGCGGCALVCPRKAIRETGKRIGVVERLEVDGISLIVGKLDIGVAMAPPLIRGVKAQLNRKKTAILDAPPGTSCPVIATVRGSDFVVLVTEPTPFGLHDLRLAVDMIRELAIPFGVVVNRMGIGDDRVHRYCREKDIPILLELPDDRRIAEAYSRGELMVDAVPEYASNFATLLLNIREYKDALAYRDPS
jgi:MinD superfamily P-loop ATPase